MSNGYDCFDNGVPSNVFYPARPRGSVAATSAVPVLVDDSSLPCPEETAAFVDKKKKGSWIWGLIGIIAIGLLLWWLIASITKKNKRNAQANAEAGNGRVVVGLTTSAENLQQLTRAEIGISKVEVQRTVDVASGNWTVVNGNSQNVDLVQLRNAQDVQVIADNSSIPVGTYQLLKLTINHVSVTDTNGVTKSVAMPSADIIVPGRFDVLPNGVTSLIVDIILDDSLFVTVANEPIFAPVLRYETRNGVSSVDTTNNRLKLGSLGQLQTQSKVGMDVNGRVNEGLGIPQNARLAIQNNRIVQLPWSATATTTNATGAGALPGAVAAAVGVPAAAVGLGGVLGNLGQGSAPYQQAVPGEVVPPQQQNFGSGNSGRRAGARYMSPQEWSQSKKRVSPTTS